jgi:hypothetical protein
MIVRGHSFFSCAEMRYIFSLFSLFFDAPETSAWQGR